VALRVPPERHGERLDAAAAALAGLPRARVRRWIDQGRVLCGGVAARAGQRVRAGDALELHPPPPEPEEPGPEALPVRVLHEDAWLVVVDKEAGMVVHPAPGHPGGTLVNALLHRCGSLASSGDPLRPGVVHRLDRGTSGAMVVARSEQALHGLAEQFRDHGVERVYQAFVRGLPGADEGEVDRPLGRHPRDRKRMSVATRAGRPAVTRWRVAARWHASGVSRLEVRPRTGRTHQIRVHLASAGLPILGDPVYGGGRREAGLERPALHAAVLGFRHPHSGERLRFEAPLPPDLRSLVARLDAREHSR